MKNRPICLICFGLAFLLTTGMKMESITLVSATINTENSIDLQFNTPHVDVHIKDFSLQPSLAIIELQEIDRKIRLITEPIDLTQSLELSFRDQVWQVQPGQVLDRYYSDFPLGCTWNDQETIFRLFTPRAKSVTLILFSGIEDSTGTDHPMQRDANGVWCARIPGTHFGKYYGYRIDGPDGPSELFDSDKIVADPYSPALASRNEYLHRSRTLIRDFSDFDWQGDRPLGIAPEDLIIYECHVRDMTAHPTSGVSRYAAGTYAALIDSSIRGGISYIRSLGVNAVEFLPIHEFGNIEIPFGIAVDGVTNTWNPYARNHWGYMTSGFFAPESYYAGEASLEPGHYSGADGQQVNDFKEVVKAFHRAGIAVILDVVYNHVAQYDQNSFKLIDKKYYFHLDEKGDFLSASGCGNDFHTARPMARRLILDSIRYWMTEYHIDGFRFDLAAMIDWETLEQIRDMAREINPAVILIAEPWGGGNYEPSGFSQIDWAAWNDQFRNGVKGQNPETGLGYVFGCWWGGDNLESLKKYLGGTLIGDGGLYIKTAHAVNYLASHDDHTLGDFIRIGSGVTKAHHPIRDVELHARLTPLQLRLNKLAAVILFASQGPVMIAQGQEYAQSKVIAPTKAPDPSVGFIDHNSYNKDNETNWLNYRHADLNRSLVDYYRGLIALRKRHPALRRTARDEMTFFPGNHDLALGVFLPRSASGDSHDVLILLNSHPEQTAFFTVPEGEWTVVVDEVLAGTVPLYRVSGNRFECSPIAAMVLIR
ncbi:DUF3459 domain-containing protein [candidate division KSB1 bacterium]|nr:DUF3459 domain-containing protein [candidate division KSB1 bacterium]